MCIRDSYKGDIESGRLNDFQAFELAGCMLIKMSEMMWITSEGGSKFFAGYQPFVNMCVGGVTREGRDATNELTYLLMDAVRPVSYTHLDLEDNWQLDITNPADVQNDLAVVLGASPVLEEVPSEILGTSFTFTPEVSGDYYVYVSNKKVEKVSALMGENTKSFDNINRGYMLELGWISAGEEVTLRNDDNEQDLVAMAYRFIPEGLESVYNVLNRNSMELTKKTDTEISGRIEAERAGLLYLSIPYDKGWSILVDGEETEPYKLFDTFLSVRLTAGTHIVELRYMPQGLKTGGMITAGSIVLLLLIAGITAGRRKKPVMRRRIKC